MSRLHHYIVEGASGRRTGMQWDVWLSEVRKKCKYAINVTKKSRYVFWHLDRTISASFSPVFKAKTRPQRRPLDTMDWAHKMMDDWFFKEFGWKARSENVVFIEGYPKKSAINKPWIIRGQTIIFPVGNPFKYIWSPKIQDMTSDLDINKSDYDDQVQSEFEGEDFEFPWEDDNKGIKKSKDEIEMRVKQEKVRVIEETMSDGKYTDKDILGAIRSGNEIMIQCKEYYAMLVDPKTIEAQLAEILI